jgi:hypothetical protein
MDPQRQHLTHRQKERAARNVERQQHEQAQLGQIRTIHPAWFVALGTLLIVAVVTLWTIM